MYVYLLKDRKYVLGKLVDNKFRPLLRYEEFPKLPTTDAKNEEVLKELGISYKVDGSELKIFDKEAIEWNAFSLPVVVEVFGDLRATKNRKDFTYPTRESVEKAFACFELLTKELEKREQEKLQQKILSKKKADDELMNRLKEEAGNSLALICVDETQFYEFSSAIQRANMIVLWGICFFKYVVLLNTKGMNGKKNSLVLNVPSDFPVGRFIGKGGQNVKKLASRLGVKYIKVVVKE